MHCEQLKYLPFFHHIDTSVMQELATNANLKYYHKGQILFNHGDLVKYFYIINSGWLKLFRNTLDGQEALVGLAKTGDIIGEIDCEHQNHSFSAKIINNAQLLLLPQKIIISNIKTNGLFALRIISALSSTINMLEIQLEHASTMKTAQRIACFILRLCNCRKGLVEIELPYEKTLVASHLGMKRETFSRGMQELKNYGVKVRRNTITIADIDELIKFCCVSCSLDYESCSS